MKSGREHRVPISGAAFAVLEQVQPLALRRDGKPDPAAPVFPGPRRALPMSNMTMLMLLRRMKRDDLTAHGFRSTFSDWAAEHSIPARSGRNGARARGREQGRCCLSPRRSIRQTATVNDGLGAFLRSAASRRGGTAARRRVKVAAPSSNRPPRCGSRDVDIVVTGTERR